MTKQNDSKPFLLPTPLGGSAELSREQYRTLMEGGGISPRNLSIIASAALILNSLEEDKPRKLTEVSSSIHGVDETVPSVTERRACTALVRSKLVTMVGAGPGVRYILPAVS